MKRVMAAVALLAAGGAALASGFGDYRAGMFAADKGQFDQAIALLGKALGESLSAELQESAYYTRGVIFHRQGQYDRAIADYSSAIKLNPNDAKAHNNRGVAYKNQHRYDLALADYNAALQLDPNNASAYFNRANAYAHQGQYDRAIADFSAAIRVHPGDASAAGHGFDESQFRPAASAAKPPAPASAGSEGAQYVLIWRYLAERRSGEDARAELVQGAGRLGSRAWPYPVIAFLLGKLPRAELMAAAGGTTAPGPHSCEAAAFVGEDDLLRGNTDSALHLFNQALQLCPDTSVEYAMVDAERQRGPARQ